MKFLLDTHVLLWAAAEPQRLSKTGRSLLGDMSNELFFSPASIWEVAIKRGLGRTDFQADPRLLLRGLMDNGYSELPVSSVHAVTTEILPAIHKDPFDRILLAQALSEGITFVTVDPLLAKYPVSVRLI